MKILYLTDSFPPESEGGADKIAFNLAKEVARRGHEVGVVTTVRDKEREGVSKEEGMRVYRIYANYHKKWRAWLSLCNPQTVGRVKKIINEFKPEVVHAHNIHYYLSYYCLKLAKKGGGKVFLTAHDVMSFTYGKLKTERYLKTAAEGRPDYKVSWLDNLRTAKKRFNPLRNFLIRRYLKYADKIIAVSEALKEALKQNGIGNVEAMRNGIDWEKFSIINEGFLNKKGEYFKERLEVKEGEKVILFGGRLSLAKGVRQLFEAAAMIKKDVDFKIAIFGDDKNSREKVRKEAEAAGVLERAVFLGKVLNEKLREIYALADLVVVPSVCFDSLPTVILEAMAAGKPVVGTCFGGTSEMVIDGKTGYIVNPFNTEVMAEKMNMILKNKNLAEEMGKAGKERVEREFSLEEWADKTLELYGRF